MHMSKHVKAINWDRSGDFCSRAWAPLVVLKGDWLQASKIFYHFSVIALLCSFNLCLRSLLNWQLAVRHGTNLLTRLFTEPRHGEGVTNLSILAGQAGHFMPNNASHIPTKPDEDLLSFWQTLSIPRRPLNARLNSSVGWLPEDSTSSDLNQYSIAFYFLAFARQKLWP